MSCFEFVKLGCYGAVTSFQNFEDTYGSRSVLFVEMQGFATASISSTLKTDRSQECGFFTYLILSISILGNPGLLSHRFVSTFKSR
jgi:hypothetical protein